ncbi:unnamed protein product [Penicillium roqueforti FM164]|uniref:Genomic scaffold, ProqFM164S01 n=1 Tax=Penicillium roqueforti (strain FM164) TaxID=1365484 RepID=W6PSB4_PENRF|nr:unnamed protein product [Penicillium roqueforti FM164]
MTISESETETQTQTQFQDLLIPRLTINLEAKVKPPNNGVAVASRALHHPCKPVSPFP